MVLNLPLFLAYTCLNELKTIPCPKTSDFSMYLKIIFVLESNLYWKLKGIFLLSLYFLQLSMAGKLNQYQS